MGLNQQFDAFAQGPVGVSTERQSQVSYQTFPIEYVPCPDQTDFFATGDASQECGATNGQGCDCARCLHLSFHLGSRAGLQEQMNFCDGADPGQFSTENFPTHDAGGLWYNDIDWRSTPSSGESLCAVPGFHPFYEPLNQIMKADDVQPEDCAFRSASPTRDGQTSIPECCLSGLEAVSELSKEVPLEETRCPKACDTCRRAKVRCRSGGRGGICQLAVGRKIIRYSPQKRAISSADPDTRSILGTKKVYMGRKCRKCSKNNYPCDLRTTVTTQKLGAKDRKDRKTCARHAVSDAFALGHLTTWSRIPSS